MAAKNKYILVAYWTGFHRVSRFRPTRDGVLCVLNEDDISYCDTGCAACINFSGVEKETIESSERR